MAYTTINKPSQYFNTVTYSGNGVNPTSITSVGFKPDLLWIKCRSNAVSNLLFDAVRGVSKRLISNSTAAETTETQIASFDTNGWTMDADTANNGSGRTYVAWNWLASNTTVSNTAGTLTSTVSANTTAGFSIVSYTATSGTSSIGHGLGVAPSMIILKTRDQTGNWITGLAVNGWDKYLTLDTTNANVTDDRMFSPSAGTDPTSTLFWSNQAAIGSAGAMIAYCFADVKGFSKFSSFTGNGSTDGTFVYTGFKPAWVLIKRTTDTHSWHLLDNKRNTYNPLNLYLNPNANVADLTYNYVMDFCSNGFKLRDSDPTFNGSGAPFIYAAFAENPFVSSTFIPTTAR